MEEPVLPDAVRNCSGGPEYHWHGEWIVAQVLGFVVAALVAPRLFGDESAGFILLATMILVWFIGTYRLAARHADPNSFLDFEERRLEG